MELRNVSLTLFGEEEAPAAEAEPEAKPEFVTVEEILFD